MEEHYAADIEAVRLLGDEIGYGNMMDIASVLWAMRLEESGLSPDVTGHVPTAPGFMVAKEKARTLAHIKARKEMYRAMGFSKAQTGA